MKQRPKHTVGKADVVFVEVLLRQVESCEGQRPIGDDSGLSARLGRHLSAPTKPDASALLQSGADRNSESPGVRPGASARCHPIGDYNQSPLGRACAKISPFRLPWCCGRVGSPGYSEVGLRHFRLAATASANTDAIPNVPVAIIRLGYL